MTEQRAKRKLSAILSADVKGETVLYPLGNEFGAVNDND